MELIEILTIVFTSIIVLVIIGTYAYKKIKHKPMGECCSCSKSKKNALLKYYYKNKKSS